MKLELQSAANFLVHLIKLGRKHTGSEAQLEKFKLAVVEVLRRRYRDHWFPDKPFKGSGYRCIRINGRIDPIIAQAAEIVGLPANTIHQTFPSELTMWIDPLEVSYRIGENGSICVLYEFKENTDNVAWKPPSSSATSSTKATNNSSVSSSPVKTHIVDNGPLPKSTPTSPYHSTSSNNQMNHLNNHHSNLNAINSKTAACKDSLYKIDCLLDPRKSVSIEQLAAYVSS